MRAPARAETQFHNVTRLESTLMDATAIALLGIALAGIAAAIVGFNTLAGKGPRGTVWLVAACVFTWAAILPTVLRDPDEPTLPRTLEILISVLHLCGVIGFVIGVLDLLQERAGHLRHPLAAWALRQPVLWGAIACANFYALLFRGTIANSLLSRYTAGHPVEVIEAAFFFVGMAMLVIRLLDLIGQGRLLRGVMLGPVPAGGQGIIECDRLLESITELPVTIQDSYLVRRLHEALLFVQRKASSGGLDQHLRHLEELDAVRMNSAYATLRIIIWAIPILGFLGTVIGITVAIANLSPEALERSMSVVTQGLGVAFDTTAEALALTMILMFMKAIVEKVEHRLLADVDAQVSRELVGRFQDGVVEHDPSVAVIRRMSQQVLEAVESLAAQQAQAWKSSIEETHQHWAETSLATGKLVRDSLSASIAHNLELHAKALEDSAQIHAERLTGSSAAHMDRLAATANQHAQSLTHGSQETVGRLREGLEKLAELLVEALHQHGEVLTKSESDLAEENRQHLTEVQAALGKAMVEAAERQERLVAQGEHLLKEMQIALVEAAGASVQQQQELVRQGDVLLKVVDATGQLAKLENTLNQNLTTVGRAYNFEEMALTLSAAIGLLSARLGHQAFSAPAAHLSGGEAASKAA